MRAVTLSYKDVINLSPRCDSVLLQNNKIINNIPFGGSRIDRLDGVQVGL